MSRYSRDEEETEGHKFKWFGNNRHVCDVLSDMRKCTETLNFSPMMGLIEEAQVMANRMESALGDRKDLIDLNQELSKARKAYKELKREYKALMNQTKPLKPKAKAESKS
jgi:hypothetical protein